MRRGDKNIGKELVSEIRERLLEKNENFLVLVVGSPGYGKSWGGLRLCEAVDESFDVNRVALTGADFMKILNKGKTVPGNAVLFDEYQISSYAREWQSDMNKAIQHVVETFRNMNLMVVFTTPKISFIDKNTRSLVHCIIEMKGKNVKEGVSKAKINFTQLKNDPNDSREFDYFRPRFYDGERVSIVDFITFSKPSKKLREKYEEKLVVFKKKVRIDMAAKMSGEGKKPKKVTTLDRIREITGWPREKITKLNIIKAYNLSPSQAGALLKLSLEELNTHPAS